MDIVWDCIIVGGGAAGMSAGLVLGRARRRTLVVDAGNQSNLAAHGIGGLLGHDGRPPAELYAIGRRELAAYPSVELRTGEVVAGERIGDVFELQLADGRRERTRRVLLASGILEMPLFSRKNNVRPSAVSSAFWNAPSAMRRRSVPSMLIANRPGPAPPAAAPPAPGAAPRPPPRPPPAPAPPPEMK